MRVVHLQRKPHPGQVSIETVFDAVREHLPRYDVELVVSSQPNTGLVPRLRAVWEARQHQGDVTHVVGDIHFVVLLLRRRTTVLTIHDVEFQQRHGGLKGALYRWLWVRLPVWRSAVVTTVSEQTRSDVLALVPRAGDVRVVPNPVRDLFTPTPLPGGRRVLLMGTWPNKNLTRSVEALTGLDVQVDLVGPLTEEQRALVAPLDVTHHEDLGDAEVRDLLRDVDLLLFPSLSEGFGVPIIEAQASGRPVITSDRAPMNQVAGEGGALLVDPLDTAAVRAAVCRVLDEPGLAASLVEAGLRNVERYRPQAVADAYAAVYDELVSG